MRWLLVILSCAIQLNSIAKGKFKNALEAINPLLFYKKKRLNQ
jgi:hypothetical protein